MTHRLVGRVGLVLVLVAHLGAIAIGTATASGGAEVLEDVAAEAAGDGSYVQMNAVEAFSPSGGEAIFAPGTEFEEAFAYDAADASLGRLIGLARPAPLAHPAGTVVIPKPATTDEARSHPSASTDNPTSDEPPATGTSGSPTAPPDASGKDTGQIEASNDVTDEESEEPASANTTTASTPSPCELLLSQSCEEVIAGLCAEGIVCDILQDPLGVCTEGIVCDILHNPLGVCTEGIVCDILQDPLGVCTEGIVCDIVHDPGSCDEESVACDIRNDPLGPWSVCDVNSSGAECPDPEDVIDLVWGTSLGGLDCVAGVTGPGISNNGGFVEGSGSFDCGEFVSVITIEVCLYRSMGGPWLRVGCRDKAKGQDTLDGVWGSIRQTIAEPCGKGTTQKYKIRAKGWAMDGAGPGGQVDEDRDTAKATATLFCPGISAEGATGDATDYVDSWVPTDE